MRTENENWATADFSLEGGCMPLSAFPHAVIRFFSPLIRMTLSVFFIRFFHPLFQSLIIANSDMDNSNSNFKSFIQIQNPDV